tara:strand:- start:314 stop:583 length:270 start_codon:yes stop_codon:yes gene_type:complete
MVILGSFLSNLLDPGTLIIILILGFIKFNKILMIIYAVIAGFLAEALSGMVNPSKGFQFGSLIFGIFATLIQALIAYFVIKLIKNRKKA